MPRIPNPETPASGSIVRSEHGQASLMIGMMMMTFIMLFAFVVNTGMLVNAKINLQNAADLAAYAGAAVQARQLNDISYLNYDMRRQYKKFLYRYYVIGNMASAYFPRGGGGGGGAPQWGPGPQAPGLNYGVPAVCVAFTSTGPDDNYCQVGNLQHINIPNSSAALNAFDLINSTLQQQLGAIELLRESNCGKIAEANTTLLLLWLFNTSPDLQSLTQAIAGTGAGPSDAKSILQISRASAQGLGLIPRELILHERINTLESYVNEPAQTGVKKTAIDALQQQVDPAANERTIQAFLSAYYTLGNHTFSDDTQIVMDELLPGGGDQANLLALNPISESFDAYSVGFNLAGGLLPTSAAQAQAQPSDCVPQLTPVTVRNVPLGVYKDPSVLTFYALRLRATAKVMFSPFGDIQLTAYAAARPFGSRIGPPQPTFTMGGTGSGIGSTSGVVGKIPNLPISPQDAQSGLTAGKGWDNDTVLGSMYSQFFPGGSAPIGSVLNGANFDAGLQAGMAPNPVEGNVYNILNDAPDPFVTSFDALHQISFWAPIISPAKISNIKSVLTTDFNQILNGVGTPQNTITGTASTAALLNAMTANIINYVDSLESGAGEILAGSPQGGRCSPGSCVQEGVNIAHIQDPFVQTDGQPIQLGSSIMIPPTDITALKTSYVTTLDPSFTAEGRVGYSVKFVSFDSLMKTGTDATGGGPVDKPSFLDGPAQQDLKQIQH